MLAACAPRGDDLTPGQREAVVASVDSAMHAFEAAERSRSAETLVGMLAPLPTFHVWNDGRRVDYQTLVDGVLAGFRSLRRVEGGFDSIEVTVLGRTAAVASSPFHEVVTDTSGSVSLISGVATWIWQKRGVRWQIVGGHVEHRQVLRP